MDFLYPFIKKRKDLKSGSHALYPIRFLFVFQFNVAPDVKSKTNQWNSRTANFGYESTASAAVW